MIALALLIEAAFGYPPRLFTSIGHPVVWMGWLIDGLDRRLNRPGRGRAFGVLALGLLLVAAITPARLIEDGAALLPQPERLLLLAILSSALLAQRSLYEYVRAVADGLDQGLAEGRAAVAHIVGRDPATLDTAAVARAAIESLAENFSDGIVAPALWGMVFGLPGIVAYKAINTADSMIGHRTPRHQDFGWSAARADDVINLPASRLAALLIGCAAGLHGVRLVQPWRAVRRDSARHRSPNAGWPEAAMAGALGLRLAGPRVYGGTRVDDAWMGDGTDQATVADIRRALELYKTSCGLFIALAGIVALLSG